MIAISLSLVTGFVGENDHNLRKEFEELLRFRCKDRKMFHKIKVIN